MLLVFILVKKQVIEALRHLQMRIMLTKKARTQLKAYAEDDHIHLCLFLLGRNSSHVFQTSQNVIKSSHKV